MFAKLKQKIQEEGRADLSKGFTSPGIVAGVDSTGKGVAVAALSDASSDDSVTSINKGVSNDDEHSSRLKNTAVNGNVSQMFSIMDSPNKRDGIDVLDLEQKIKMLNKSLKEECKQKEKLQTMLEKFQDSQTKRNDEKEAKLASLQIHINELTGKLQEASMWKEKYIRDHETVEELEDFQTQELAKVKHLFLISQQELQQKEESIKIKDADLELCRAECKNFKEELLILKERNKTLESENIEIKHQARNLADSLTELQDHNDCSEKRIDQLNVQVHEADGQIHHLQKLLADLRDERDSIKHSFEIHAKKYSSELKENTSNISHLEEKVASLSKRLANNDLGDDDRIQALSVERDALEDKLEESRQHLNEVKSNWCTKIESLEIQIAHLNQKIAEDTEEFLCIEQHKATLENQVSDLELKLISAKAANQELLEKAKRCEEDANYAIQSLKKKLESVCHEKDVTVSELQQIQKQLDQEKIISSTRLCELEVLNKEQLPKLHQAEQQVSALKNEMALLEKRCEAQLEEISSISLLLENTRQEVNQLTEKNSELNRGFLFQCNAAKTAQEKYFETESALNNMVKERDLLHENNLVLSEVNDGLKIQLESERSERKEQFEIMQNKIQEFQAALESAESDSHVLRKTVSDLERSIGTNSADSVDQLRELKSMITNLETQLLEKNKTIKLQQQRIGDMKKTLQRELKIQSESAAEINQIEVLSKDVGIQPHLNRVPSKASFDAFAHARPSSLADKLDDINFRYIKHVILKFITSTEYEAQQLIKAIAVLLEFSREEEQLVRETLCWKTSWFGSKPQMIRPHVGNRTIMS